jgi:hypothetical protein
LTYLFIYSYNLYSSFLNTLTKNVANNNHQNTKNVQLYQNICIRTHQATSHKTFARFDIIFIGAEEAFESICFKLFLVA